MSTNVNPVCPTGCDTPVPSADFNFCAPVNSFGEVTHIFLASLEAECFTDVEDVDEWLARLDNTTTDINAIRFLHVSADWPAGERDTIETSLYRKVKTPATFTINVDVDDVSDLNYEFMRASQCNIVWRLWFVAGDYLFGGICGVEANLNLDYVVERGSKSIQKITGTAQWEASFSPERVDNPLSGQTLSD